MTKLVAVAAQLLFAALAVSACVSEDPNRTYDYENVGFRSDDGSR